MTIRLIPILVVTLVVAAAATGQAPPPWRTPGWEGAPPAGEPAPDGEDGAAATADGAATTADDAAAEPPADGEPPRFLGEAATFLATQPLLEAGPAREKLCARCLVLRSDGARVVVADNAAEHPTVRLFAPYPGGELRERGYLLGHLSPLRALLLTDDFRVLATAGGAAGEDADDSLRLWNAEKLNRRTPALKLRHGAPTALAAPPDGKLFAVGDTGGRVTVFRDRHGRQRGRSAELYDSPVGALAFTPDGRTLYVAAGGGAAPIRAARPRPLAVRDAPVPFEPGAAVTALAVGRVGDRTGALLVGEASGRLTAVAPADGTVLWRVRAEGAIRRIRSLPDEGVVLVAAEGSPRPLVLDARSGAARPTLPARHPTGLVDVAFDRDTGLVTLAHRDGVIELWRRAGAPHPDRWR